jgi:3-methyladenine DNA glycosylase/8-oxoguanine DNA glycosylase
MRITAGEVLRATRTPEGPGTELLRRAGNTIEVRAWGPGAEWLCERAPVLVGGNDDHSVFPDISVTVSSWHRQFPGMRTPCTQSVWESLLPTVLEQKVTGIEARDSFGALLRVANEPAPGPFEHLRLVLPLDPATVAGWPSHVFHAANVERKRSDVIRRAAGYAQRLAEIAEMPLLEGTARLSLLPGIGAWSVAEIAQTALGDADAVSVGDYHLKNWVSWALAGEPRGSDDRMLELLEPFRPFRGRVIRLIGMAGIRPPRYGPRLTIQPRW